MSSYCIVVSLEYTQRFLSPSQKLVTSPKVYISSFLRVAKKLSTGALSQQLPLRLMLSSKTFPPQGSPKVMAGELLSPIRVKEEPYAGPRPF
jgi:hypothetical protein